jgi:hypothetical protein
MCQLQVLLAGKQAAVLRCCEVQRATRRGRRGQQGVHSRAIRMAACWSFFTLFLLHSCFSPNRACKGGSLVFSPVFPPVEAEPGRLFSSIFDDIHGGGGSEHGGACERHSTGRPSGPSLCEKKRMSFEC